MSATRAIRPIAVAMALGAAAPANAEPDLVLHHAPAALPMRPRKATQVAATTPTPAAVRAEPPPQVDQRFRPLPTSLRDLQERVVFRVNAGYDLDGAGASGTPLRGGAALPSGFSGSRSWVLGDAMIGARDILLPSLGGYFLSSYQFDAGGALASRTARVVPGDATDQRIAVKAGYAEYQTDDKDGSHLWLRAGRQFRLDGGAMFAYFDGGAVGYRSHGLDVSGFGGERVALYIDTPRGVTFGGTAAVDLKKLRDWPVKVGLDYMALSIGINDGLGAAGADQTQLRQLLAVTGNVELSRQAHVDIRARVVDGGAGLSFGRAGARLRYAASRDLMVVADLDQRGRGDLAYDLASPTAVDVVDISRRLGVGIVAPTTSTMLGAHVDWRRGSHELLVFGRADLAEGTVTNVAQQSWIEGGTAVAAAPRADVWATLQYTFRAYFLNANANQAGSAFDDTSGSGLASLHELALDGWWRSPRANHWRLGGGVFYRIYNFETPYVTTDHEGRGGGRVDARYALTAMLHVIAAAEVAQSSPTIMREIGTLASIRAAVEARW
jgi:hypothetical protein